MRITVQATVPMDIVGTPAMILSMFEKHWPFSDDIALGIREGDKIEFDFVPSTSEDTEDFSNASNEKRLVGKIGEKRFSQVTWSYDSGGCDLRITIRDVGQVQCLSEEELRLAAVTGWRLVNTRVNMYQMGKVGVESIDMNVGMEQAYEKYVPEHLRTRRDGYLV